MNANTQQILNGLVLYLVPLIFALAIHEWGHAWSAVALGDNTPKEEGRLTLNPVVHIDPIGTLAVPIFMIVSGFTPFGWAKPVNVTPYRFTRKVKMRTGLMLTAAAGPLMNLGLATIAAFTLQAMLHYHWMPGGVGTHRLLEALVRMNVVLFVFNLIPLPPLDGSRVLGGLLPRSLQEAFEMLQRFSPIFLAILFFTGIGGKLISGPSLVLADGMYHFAGLFFPVHAPIH